MMNKQFLTLILLVGSGISASAQIVNTVAGGGYPNNIAATSANLNYPQSVAVDGAGNIFIAARSANRIYRVDGATGIITSIAGNGLIGFSGDGGPATSARLSSPTGVGLDGSGNLYIADLGSQRIRKVSASTGNISTVAGNGNYGYSGDGGPAASASFRYPSAIAVDAAGSIYIADTNNYVIRKVDGSGIISTVAGDGTSGFAGDGGPASSARLSSVYGLAVDSSGNLFIADNSNYRIRKVTSATGIITTIAGDGTIGYAGDGGPALSAKLNNVNGLAVDASGDLFIADYYRVRRVAGATGIISTFAGGIGGFAGDGGPAAAAKFNFIYGLAIGLSGDLYVADTVNSRIRRVAASGIVSTVAGNGNAGFSGDGGPADSAELFYPRSVALDASGNLFIADSSNGRVRRVDAVSGFISTFAGGGAGSLGDGGPATSASLYPTGLAFDAIGDLYIVDAQRIRKVTAATGVISTQITH